MSSIMTNASAMTALQTLNATNKNLAATQSRISTGLRVSEASDNAAYWSIATTMRSDHKALSTVQDALGLGASKLDTAYTGMNKAIETINEIKVKLVAAAGATDSDKGKIQTEIEALQNQLKAYAEAATFSGTNVLSVTSDKTVDGEDAGTNDAVQQDLKIVSAFNRTAAGAASISTIDVSVEDVKLYDNGDAGAIEKAGILDANRSATGARADIADDAWEADYTVAADDADVNYSVAKLSLKDSAGVYASQDHIENMIQVVEEALKEMTTAATTLGAAKNRIDLQKTFTTSLMDSIERGVGQLVDADMNKESTRLQALQVQQQLGIQALSIANGNSQSILSLFR